MDTRSVARDERALPELSATCAARVHETLAALARLDTENGAIAARQLVRATAQSEQRTRRVLRGAMTLIALTGAQ